MGNEYASDEIVLEDEAISPPLLAFARYPYVCLGSRDSGKLQNYSGTVLPPPSDELACSHLSHCKIMPVQKLFA